MSHHVACSLPGGRVVRVNAWNPRLHHVVRLVRKVVAERAAKHPDWAAEQAAVAKLAAWLDVNEDLNCTWEQQRDGTCPHEAEDSRIANQQLQAAGSPSPKVTDLTSPARSCQRTGGKIAEHHHTTTTTGGKHDAAHPQGYPVKAAAPRKAWDDALAWARTALPGRPLAALAAVTIDAAQGRVSITGFDGEILARGWTEHVTTSGRGGSVKVEAAKLRAALDGLPKTDTTITSSKSGLTLAAGASTATVPLLDIPPEHRAETPSPPQIGVTDPGLFAWVVTRALPAVSRDRAELLTHPILGHVWLVLTGDHVGVTTTDRYRVCSDAADWTPGTPLAHGVLVPAGPLEAFTRVCLDDGKLTIGWQADEGEPESQREWQAPAGWLTLSDETHDLAVHCPSGEWPSGAARFFDDAVNPDLYPYQVVVDAAAFTGALRRAAKLLTKVDQPAAEIVFNPAQSEHEDGAADPEDGGEIAKVRRGPHLLVTAHTDDGTGTTETVPAREVSWPVTAAYNPAMLADLIENIDGDVRLGLSPDGRPVYVTDADPDGYRALLCPVTLD